MRFQFASACMNSRTNGTHSFWSGTNLTEQLLVWNLPPSPRKPSSDHFQSDDPPIFRVFQVQSRHIREPRFVESCCQIVLYLTDLLLKWMLFKKYSECEVDYFQVKMQNYSNTIWKPSSKFSVFVQRWGQF